MPVIDTESKSELNEEMRPEYDFSKGVRGKYYEAYQRGVNVVFLDPDVSSFVQSNGPMLNFKLPIQIRTQPQSVQDVLLYG